MFFFFISFHVRLNFLMITNSVIIFIALISILGEIKSSQRRCTFLISINSGDVGQVLFNYLPISLKFIPLETMNDVFALKVNVLISNDIRNRDWFVCEEEKKRELDKMKEKKMMVIFGFSCGCWRFRSNRSNSSNKRKWHLNTKQWSQRPSDNLYKLMCIWIKEMQFQF